MRFVGRFATSLPLRFPFFDQWPDQHKDQNSQEPIGAHADDSRYRIDHHHAEEQGQNENRPEATPHFLDPGQLQVVFQVQAKQLRRALQSF